MFTGNVELSYRKNPHVQLIKGKALTGYPVNKRNEEAHISLVFFAKNRAIMNIGAHYKRNGFYQVKWWMMLPFSEDIQVDCQQVDVYKNDAKSVDGIKHGEFWTRIKFLHVKPGLVVKVGNFTFTVNGGDVRDLMIYRRLDNQLIELSWIWWNVDRHGEIPQRKFSSMVEMYVEGEMLDEKKVPILNRIYNKLRRIIRKARITS